MKPVYLGDGVYLSFSRGCAVLTTGTHIEDQADNVIYLEPSVIMSLLRELQEVTKNIDPEKV